MARSIDRRLARLEAAAKDRNGMEVRLLWDVDGSADEPDIVSRWPEDMMDARGHMRPPEVPDELGT